MTNRFQACIGPSSIRAHLWDQSKPKLLTLCEATGVVQNYKGRMLITKLCKKCAYTAMRELQCEVLSAEMIGVYEITTE